jgi:hypothetical protein
MIAPGCDKLRVLPEAAYDPRTRWLATSTLVLFVYVVCAVLRAEVLERTPTTVQTGLFIVVLIALAVRLGPYMTAVLYGSSMVVLASTRALAVDKLTRLASAVLQCVLDGHGFLFLHFHASVLAEKNMPGGNFFDQHCYIDVRRLAIVFLFDYVHRDRAAFMHKRIFHRYTPLWEIHDHLVQPVCC